MHQSQARFRPDWLTRAHTQRCGYPAFAILLLLLCGCDAIVPGSGPVGQGTPDGAVPGARPAGTHASGPVSLVPRSGTARAVGPAEIELGTGRFADLPGTAGSPAMQPNGAEVTLDFANVDVRDVLRSVLGGLLKVNYVVDPAVQGTVTLQTGRPVSRSAVLDVLTSALQVSGFGLTARDGLYRVVPVANAARETSSNDSSGGFVTRSVSLQYVGAADIARALEAMVPAGASIRPDPERNLLTVSGSARDVNMVLTNVASFDVDYLRGMSFALLPLRSGRSKEVADGVNAILGSSGKAVSDIVRVVPITRMNAILVTSMQPAYLDRVRRWVERFDHADRQSDLGLYVYRVQNGRAADLAAVLRRALGIGGADAAGQAANTTAGGGGSPADTPGVDIANPLAGGIGRGAGGALQMANSGGQAPGGVSGGTSQSGGNPLAGIATAATGAPGQATGNTDLAVTADTNNNALVITASAQDYARIEAVLRQLDIAPLQVLIEATVAEVTLTRDLQYGLQYYIKSGGFTGIFAPNVKVPDNGTAGVGNTIASTFPGFSFLPGSNFVYTAPGGSTVVLQALSGVTNVRVLSSPNLLVLNNRSARLQVGEQVPIATQSAISTLTSNPLAVNTIDYRDTGVILHITPRVNDNGLVLLDIAEEVSAVTQTTSSTLNSPTISQRRVTSSVAIQDGQTLGLGGLIKDARTNSHSKIPLLGDIPGLGALFSTHGDSSERTELIVLITPRILRGRDDGDAATGELRAKLQMTVPVLARARH